MKIVTDTSLEEFKKLLKDVPPSAFDGHTEFSRLSPEERLFWLSQSMQFFFEVNKQAKSNGSATAFPV
ncbi:MAG: hypothetical protein GY754_03635 [bacterium]|nr:hypothetical protein [bacterium]